MSRFAVLPACALVIASKANDSICCYGGCDAAATFCNAPSDGCGQSQSNCESCSGVWCPGSTDPTPMPTTTPSPAPSPTPVPPMPTPPAPGDKTPLYVALRMDDISIGWMSEQQQQAINWAQNKGVKFNFGIIAGVPAPWPTTCIESPSDENCDDLAVKALFDAYAKGNVVGTTGGNPVIEIFNHAWDHDEWPNQFGTANFKTWMEDDMQHAQTQLKQAFPKANIATLVAPQNLADHDVLASMDANGLSILSSQGTVGCNTPEWGPPHYNYLYGPCEHDGQLDCVPANDVYVTSEGWQQVDGIYSTPTASASSSFSSVTQGITPEQAWGEGECGCSEGNTICSVVAAAEGYAQKSNGLRWAVLMMHPQNAFPGGQRTDDWLDDFVAVARASPNYDVHFVTFQDLVQLRSPQTDTSIVV